MPSFPCRLSRRSTTRWATHYSSARCPRSIKPFVWSLPGNAYTDAGGAEIHFRGLICEPLKRHYSDDSVTLHQIVVVIDALDECEKKGRQAFLQTISEWTEQLPRTCKLLITSRGEEDIVAKLGTTTHKLVLATGDVVAQESVADIRHFFKTKLQEMKSDTVPWPDPDSVEKLTKSAAGVFAWAMTVVEYTRENPDENLKDVLSDMLEDKVEAVESKVRLGKLYGRILIKVALRWHSPEDRDRLSLVIASVRLLHNSLPLDALLELLTAGLSHRSSSDVNLNVMAIVDSLGSVIDIVTEGDNKFLRVRHRSFSEFLRDERVFRASLEIPQKNAPDHELSFPEFMPGQQHTLLAEACLRLICDTLNTRPDITSLAAGIRTAVVYAYVHWVDHLQEACADGANAADSTIRFTPLIDTFLKLHIPFWKRVLSKNGSVSEGFKELELGQHRLG